MSFVSLGTWYADAASGSEVNGIADIVNIAPGVALSPYNQAGDATSALNAIAAGRTLRFVIDESNYFEGVVTGGGAIGMHYEFYFASRSVVGTCDDSAYYEVFYDQPPKVSLSSDVDTIAENGGEVAVFATLDNTDSGNVVVSLAYSGTATRDVDYTAPGTITVLAGDATASGSIAITDDTTVEASETIVVDISSVSNGTENGSQQITITVTDNDTGGGTTINLVLGEIMQGEFKLGQTQYALEFPLFHSETGLLVTGATPSIKLKAPGAGFVSAAGTPGEIGVGYYSLSPSATDFQTLGPNLFLATAANCLPTVGRFMVVQHSPTVGLPAANPGTPGGLVTATAGSATGAVAIDSAANVAGDVKKWLGTAPLTPDTAGAPKVTIKNGTGAGEVLLTAGTVRANGTSGQILPDAATVAQVQTDTTSLLARLTTARAGYLDNLNIGTSVASGLTAAQLLTDTTSLLARLTSARAGYLDYLNVGSAVATDADIAKLLRVRAQVLPQVLRPDSGSVTFTIEVRTYSSNSVPGNADTTPTVTATGGVSGSLSSNLAAGSNPTTGVYRYTYTLTSAAVLEEIRFDVSATIGAASYTTAVYTQVAPASTFTATDRTTLGNVATASQLGNSSAQLLAAAWGTGTTANTAMTRDRLLEAACGMLVGICSGAGTITNHFAHAGGSVPNVTITVDQDGNRSAVVFN